MTEIDYTKWKYPESDLEILMDQHGYVLNIDTKRNTFWVRLEYYKPGEISDMEVPSHTLPLDERPYLIEGAFCRWRIYKDPDYEDEAIDELIFNKRTWSREEIQEAQRKAKVLNESLDWGK